MKKQFEVFAFTNNQYGKGILMKDLGCTKMIIFEKKNWEVEFPGCQKKGEVTQ